jgi:hypothetical protein
MKNNILLFCLTIGSFFYGSSLFAQQKIDPTIEVKRDFDGKMLEINKSKLDTRINDTLNNFNLNFNYSIFEKPYRDMYEFSPLPSARIHSPVTAQYPAFYANLGIGFPINPHADIYYQPRFKKSNNTLAIQGTYHSFLDDLPQVKMNTKTHKTEKSDRKVAADNYVMGLQADYGHSWNSGEFSLGAGYSSNYYTYYGFNEQGLQSLGGFNLTDSKIMRDNFSHTYNQFDVRFKVKSTDSKEKGARFNYKFYASYQNTSDKVVHTKRFTENLLKAGGELGPAFGKYNKFLIGVNSETAMYSGLFNYHYGTIEFIPQYKFEKGRLLLNLGVKISANYSNLKDANHYHNIFSPHVTVSYEILKNNLWVYGMADGGNDINSYSSLLAKNPWIIPTNQIQASAVPVLIKAGFKGKAFDKLSYELYGAYIVHKGLLQFVNSTMGESFTTVNSNHDEFTVGGIVNWKSKDFTGGLKAKYSSFSNGTPYGYAPFEGSVFGEYNWRERIYFGVDLCFRNATPFYMEKNLKSIAKMQGFLNLGATAKYVINNHFAVYLQGGNLLNDQVQYQPYHLEKGINFGAGLTVKF